MYNTVVRVQSRWLWLLGIALGCGNAPDSRPPATPQTSNPPQPAPTVTVQTTEAPPPVQTQEQPAPAWMGVPDIDFKRWQGVAALCHPEERWDKTKGCVAKAKAKQVRCGSSEDRRKACSCRVDDLMCLMRCAGNRPKRRRIPRWGEPATIPELGDCKALCALDHSPSCLRLGMAHLRGRGMTRKPKLGVDLVKKSCLGGFSEACASLFHLYSWEKASHADPLAALLAEAKCETSPESYLPLQPGRQSLRQRLGRQTRSASRQTAESPRLRTRPETLQRRALHQEATC